LIAATRWGTPNIVKHLIEAGASIDDETELDCRKSLKRAIRCGKKETVKALLLFSGKTFNNQYYLKVLGRDCLIGMNVAELCKFYMLKDQIVRLRKVH
jgi:hypothetical protein